MRRFIEGLRNVAAGAKPNRNSPRYLLVEAVVAQMRGIAMRSQLSSRLLPLVPFPQVIQSYRWQDSSDAMDVVSSKDGVIVPLRRVPDSARHDTAEGMQLDKWASVSPYFATNNETSTSELDNSASQVTDNKISPFRTCLSLRLPRARRTSAHYAAETS